MLGGGLDYGLRSDLRLPAAAGAGGLPLFEAPGGGGGAGAGGGGGWGAARPCWPGGLRGPGLGAAACDALWEAYCGASDPLIVLAALSGLVYSVHDAKLGGGWAPQA